MTSLRCGVLWGEAGKKRRVLQVGHTGCLGHSGQLDGLGLDLANQRV